MKRILKALFPRMMLKKAFLYYNQIKDKTWDILFYKKHRIPEELFEDNQKKNPFLELCIDTSVFGKELHEKFGLWNDPHWRQEQYLLNYKSTGFIEPVSGWGVSENKELIYPSLGFANAPYVHKPSIFQLYFSMKKTVRLKRIISLRDTGEENYFHFYNDVLAKLFYLNDRGIDFSKFVVVISEHLYSKPYFQYFLKRPFLNSLQWYVQGDEWIHFEEAIFCKPYTHSKKYLKQILQLVKTDGVTRDTKRIFLTRSSNSLRFIENIEELKSVLDRYDFDVVDTSVLGIQDQILLFSNCRYLIAVHGAGISNIIFRSGEPMSLLEIIHPSVYVPFHYSMLATVFGYRYQVIMGSKGVLSGQGGFMITPVALESAILKILQSG